MKSQEQNILAYIINNVDKQFLQLCETQYLSWFNPMSEAEKYSAEKHKKTYPHCYGQYELCFP